MRALPLCHSRVAARLWRDLIRSWERQGMRKPSLRGAILASIVTAALAGLAVGYIAPASAAAFNVKDYGATGNGSTNDTAAINKAINAASTAGGGVVEFPAGTYKSANSIHLKSNITLQLDAGSTVVGASGTG